MNINNFFLRYAYAKLFNYFGGKCILIQDSYKNFFFRNIGYNLEKIKLQIANTDRQECQRSCMEKYQQGQQRQGKINETKLNK